MDQDAEKEGEGDTERESEGERYIERKREREVERSGLMVIIGRSDRNLIVMEKIFHFFCIKTPQCN